MMSPLVLLSISHVQYPSAENQQLHEESTADLERVLGDKTRMKLFSATHLGMVSQNVLLSSSVQFHH